MNQRVKYCLIVVRIAIMKWCEIMNERVTYLLKKQNKNKTKQIKIIIKKPKPKQNKINKKPVNLIWIEWQEPYISSHHYTYTDQYIYSVKKYDYSVNCYHDYI